MAENLITKAEYKTYVGISNPDQDGTIDSLIPKVSQFIKNYCRTSFIDNYDDPITEIQKGGRKVIELRRYPIISASVAVSTDYGNSYTDLVENTDYVLDYDTGTIESTSNLGFIQYLKGYKITYTYGYETVPADVKLAAMDLVTYYRKNDGAVHSTRSVGSAGTLVDYITKDTLPGNIARILDLYVQDAS